jgi:uncharacterized phage protein gp47/JayE
MPYVRKTLTQLRQQVAQDLASALPGSDPLLRFANLTIMGAIQAGLAHLHNGYLDYIAQQAVPFTATAEYLEAWAALKGIFRIPATPASGLVRFNGTSGDIPSGTPLVRGDGQKYTTTADGTLVSGTVVVPATAVADPAGLVGAIGDCDVGTVFTLGTAIVGVNSTGAATNNFVGGADLEQDDALRARMLLAFQSPAHGGSQSDYVTWALAVPGVTRAWCVPNVFGSGTVGVYIMLDSAEAAHGGFPQGTNGVSQFDHGPNAGAPRDSVATGDQLVVADYIAPLQPVTALVYALAPTASPVAFTISGIASASTAVKNEINDAIDSVLLQYAQITGASTTVDISFVNSAIAAIAGTSGFVITAPAGNIVTASGALPTRGTVTYT